MNLIYWKIRHEMSYPSTLILSRFEIHSMSFPTSPGLLKKKICQAMSLQDFEKRNSYLVESKLVSLVHFLLHASGESI